MKIMPINTMNLTFGEEVDGYVPRTNKKIIQYQDSLLQKQVLWKINQVLLNFLIES